MQVVGFIFMCTMQDMKFGQTQQVTEDLPLVFFEWCMTEVKNNIAEKYGGIFFWIENTKYPLV